MSLATAEPAEAPAVLLDVQAVASMLGCSNRHVYRLSDCGRMPRPVKLGALVRWNRASVERWIVAGCLPIIDESAQSTIRWPNKNENAVARESRRFTTHNQIIRFLRCVQWVMRWVHLFVQIHRF
jgi:excisionase family DNA binding protein